jgi:Flp pilus assembly protein TadD
MVRLVLMFFAMTTACFAQAFGTAGSLSITIQKNEKQGAVPGANLMVELVNSTGGTVSRGMTNDGGEVEFANVDPGCYQIRVMHQESVTNQPCIQVIAERGRQSRIVYLESDAGVGKSTEAAVSTAALAIPEAAKSDFDRGLDAMRHDRLGDAEKRLRKAVQQYPNYADAWNALGVVAMKRGDRQVGRENFSEAMRVDPGFAPAAVNMARILVPERKNREAIQYLHKSLSLDPRNSEAWSLLALAQYNEGDFEGAIASAAKAHSFPHEGNAAMHFLAAQIYDRQRRYAELERELQTYLEETPSGLNAEQARKALKTLAARKR